MTNYAKVVRFLDRIDALVARWRLPQEAREEIVTLLDDAREDVRDEYEKKVEKVVIKNNDVVDQGSGL